MILVLFRHHGYVKELSKIGWVGVDLFFVLSGFLVSGLLFKEFSRTGKIDATNFLIRRGLKIYPAFYVLVLFTSAKAWIVNLSGISGNLNFSLSRALSEIFFVQNYFDGLWGHTWTLAVEEHFYFLLVLFILLLIKCNSINSTVVGIAFLIISLGCLILRISNYIQHDFTLETHMYYTHLRIDSLTFGVFLSSLYHFNKPLVQLYLDKYSIYILLISTTLILPIFYFEVNTFFMNSFGLSLLYVGFGGLLLVLVHRESLFNVRIIWVSKIINTVSFIGKHSYSIYLWHLPVLAYVASPLSGSLSRGYVFLVYFLGSIVIGIIASSVIEMPVLKLRDRMFSKKL